MDMKQVAKELRQKANDQLVENKKEWRGDKGMVEMFVDDYNDTKEIANLISKSKFKEAFDTLELCDTASREVIYGMLTRIDLDFTNEHFGVEYGIA